MKCPFCGENNDRVMDSRDGQGGEFTRRRRHCMSCEHRFTTYERYEEITLMVVKKDGRREPFDRNKILAGVLRACEKRPISKEQCEALVNEIELGIYDLGEREYPTKKIGEQVMSKLRALDQVAYVRFASVYKDFQDVSEFMSELKPLIGKKKIAQKKST
ncbi:MAG: transcriptional regulator NrdR [Acidobacteriota bacterium]